MKKFFSSAILAGFLGISSLSFSQEKYNLYFGDALRIKVGEAIYEKDKVVLDIIGFDKMKFFREGENYYEHSSAFGLNEKYSYSEKEGILKFIDYDYSFTSNKNIEVRRDKLNAEGRVYGKNAFFAIDAIDKIEKKRAPDTLEVIVFSYPYLVVREEELVEDGKYYRADYRLINDVFHKTDKKKIVGPIKVFLNKENYDFAGAKVKLVYTENILGNLSFNLSVWKNEKK